MCCVLCIRSLHCVLSVMCCVLCIVYWGLCICSVWYALSIVDCALVCIRACTECPNLSWVFGLGGHVWLSVGYHHCAPGHAYMAPIGHQMWVSGMGGTIHNA